MDSNTPQDVTVGGTAGQQGSGSKKDFVIPQTVVEKHGALVELIKKTESMSDEEREYWFQILPIMTEDQVARLKKILEEEVQQLANLDKTYQEELAQLNKKHLEEWNAFEKKKEREARQSKEASAEAEESAAEEALLKGLHTDEKGAGEPPAAA